jgi:hypothetical protein
MVQPIAVFAFPVTNNAYAQWQYDPKQLSMLPPYCAMGNCAAAREWLEKGLLAAPGTKALQRRLAELDAAKRRRKSSTE